MVIAASLVRRTATVVLFLAALAILSIAPGAISAQGTESEEATESPVWSADMSVVEYTSISIGAASADLFSNIGGSADFQIKSLWSYIPDRDLRLSFEDGVPDAADYTLQVGDLTLEFPEESSGNSSFKWTDVDVDWEDGQTISVRIVQTSALEEPAANTPATGEPAISGTAQVDQTLTANTSAIADEDGLDDVSYSYQWLANDGNSDADIKDATDSTYTSSVGDVGKTIKVSVSFTDDRNNAEARTSVATAAVLATVPTEPLNLTVTRGSQIQELDASWQAPSSNGGSAVTGYKLQWKEAADSWDTEADVSQATVTGTTHKITGLTGGMKYAVRVIATNDTGGSPASSEATETPAGGTSQQNTEPENNAPAGLPTVSGTPQVEQTLTADTSGISDSDGLISVSYSYQWIAGGTDIDAATGSSYTLTSSELGKTIQVGVSFADDRDNAESLTSAATAAVTRPPPSRAPEMDGISIHDGMLRILGGDLELVDSSVPAADHGVPAADVGWYISSFKVQWKSGSQGYDATRQAVLAPKPMTATNVTYYFAHMPSYDITGLTNGVEYTVRVIATNAGGDGPPSQEQTATPGTKSEELWKYIEDEIVEEHEASHPWLRQTLNYLQNNNIPLNVWNSDWWPKSTYFDNSAGINAYYVRSLNFSVSTVDGAEATKKETILGELAYIYTMTNGVSSTPAPLGIAYVYFGTVDTLWLGGCWDSRLYLDVVVSLVTHDSLAGASDWNRCMARSEDATALAVVRSALSGQTPEWFADTYNDSEGNPDLEQLWSDVGIVGHQEVVAYQLRNSFGGYCDTARAWDVRISRSLSRALAGSGYDTLLNPWRDGGCVPSAPITLTASLTEDGTASVSWAAPESNGGSLLSGYRIQWQSVDAEEGTTPQTKYVDFDDWSDEARPTEVSETIDGLTDGVEYKVRVLAYNPNGDGTAAEVTVPEPNAAPTGVPEISGTPQVDQTLHVAAPDPEAYVTVVITSSDDTVSWSDPDECTSNYNTYLNVTSGPGSGTKTRTHIGSVASGSTEATQTITYSWTSESSRPSGVELELYCGTFDASSHQNVLIASTYLATRYRALREGTYSSAPLTALSISSGTLSPAFDRGINGYTAEVPNDIEVITLDPTVLTGYQTDFVRNPGWGVIQGCGRDCNYSYGNGTTTGIVLADADEETEGFQINLNRGENRLGIGVNKGNMNAGPGRLYVLTVTVENSPATGQPTISGTAQVGQTLTADTSGISDVDGLDNVSYSYQWLSSRDTEIDGATSSTYTFQSSDNGKLIKVRVTFTDDAGYDESLTSEATVAVAAAVPTAPLSLTVTPGDQSQELHASWQAPSSNGGSDVTGYKVQWKESTDSWDTEANVSEATVTGTSHTITSLTGGVEYTVRVIASNVAGDGPPSTEARATPTDSPTSGEEGTETVESDSTAAWTATLTVGVSGSGSEAVWGYSWFRDGMGTLDERTYNEGDQTIEVMAILLSNGFVAFNVRPHPSVDFVLTVDGTEFASADASEVKSRTLISYVWATRLDWAEDDRVALSLTLKDTDSAEQSEPAENTPATGLPTITGTPQVDETLTASTSAINDEDGLEDVSYSYQWISNDGNGDTDIEDATDSTYTPSVSDVGKTIKVKVTFTDDRNNAEARTSLATTAVLATVPTQPLSLTVATGDEIQELDASWQAPSSNGGAEITGYKVQWKRSADSWDTEADVSQATVTGTMHTIPGLTGGVEYAVRVIASNTAGDGPASDEVAGTPAGGTSQQQTGDSTSPTVSSIAITSDTGDEESTWDDDGIYGIGDIISVTVTFSEDVTVKGSPRLELNIGGAAKKAEYKSAVGSKVVFSYTVAEGDSDSDGIAISENKLTLNGGNIKDAADNAADLTHDALAAQADHQVDGVRPTISLVALGYTTGGVVDDTYILGQELPFAVKFSEEVIADGSPQLTLDFDSGPKQATFFYIRLPCLPSEIGASDIVLVSSNGCLTSDTRGLVMVFSYTISMGDEDSDGLGIGANALSANGTISDAAGNEAVLTHEAVADSSNHKIDGVPPEVTSIEIISDPGEDDTYAAGDIIKLNVTFSERLEVLWQYPRLRLDIGDKARMAYRVSRNPLDIRAGEIGYVMAYSYTVQDGDKDDDGISIPANALHRLWGELQDTNGNEVELGHEALASDASHKVATTFVESNDTTAKTGLLTITGTLRVGEIVTADLSNLTDDDGLDYAADSAHYAWGREGGGLYFEAMRDPRYRIAAADKGKKLRVDLQFFDDNGNKEYRRSAWTDPVGLRAPSNNSATGAPTITGTPQVDQTLTANTSSIDDGDGLDSVSYSYQWIGSNGNSDTDIEDATDSTYTPSSGDVGKTIKVKVSFTDDADNDETLTSEATVAVAATVPSAPQGMTVTSGSQTQELEASWQAPSSNGGSAVTGYKVQWKEAPDSWDTAADVSQATETGTTYTITSLTGGVEYAVRVIATNDVGDGPASTEAKGTPAGGVSEQGVEPENSAPTGLPGIGGTPQVDQTLTASTSPIDDEDGLTNVSYRYQWIAGGTDIDGATGSTYTLTASEQGQTIQVRVTFTDDAGNEETLTSEATAAAAPAPLTAAFQDLPDSHDGSTAFTFRVLFSEDVGISYVNMRDDAFSLSEGDVTGARRVDGRNDLWEITVEPDDNSDVGITLPANRSCTTTGAICTREDSPRQLTNSPTATVTGPAEAPPTNTSAAGAPTISGTPQVEQTLTADTSSITDEDGLTNVSYSYQWIAGGSDIAGATGSTYTLTSSEQGQTIQVRVTFTDDADNEETLTSIATVAVAAAPNRDATGKPTISGTPQVDQTLTADTSPIDDADGLTNVSYSYQWIAGGSDIAGATGSTYTLTSSQQGKDHPGAGDLHRRRR